MGRPSGYSEEVVARMCGVIRRRGISDAQAARTVGISRATLGRWKRDHEELEDWLAMAREQYREAKLTIVDEAKTADGRPDWKAAVWALEKAFPEDYGRGAAAARRAPAPWAAGSSSSNWPDETLEEWKARNLTPEIREFIRLANEEEEERLAQEEALAAQS
jgi:DNA-binding XRE family transcriptional regulator